jgi:hypothetical protein
MASSRPGGNLPTVRVDDGDLDPLDPLSPPSLDLDGGPRVHNSTGPITTNPTTTDPSSTTTKLPTRSIAFGQVYNDDGITLGPVVSTFPSSSSPPSSRARRSGSGFLGLDLDLDPLAIVEETGSVNDEGKGYNIGKEGTRQSDIQAVPKAPVGVQDFGRLSTSLDSQQYRQSSQLSHYSQGHQHPGLASVDSDETTQSKSSLPAISASAPSSSSLVPKTPQGQGGNGATHAGGSGAGGAGGNGPKFARGTNEVLKKVTLEEVLDGSSCSPIS